MRCINLLRHGRGFRATFVRNVLAVTCTGEFFVMRLFWGEREATISVAQHIVKDVAELLNASGINRNGEQSLEGHVPISGQKENYPMPPHFPSGLARRFRTVVSAVLGGALLASAGAAALASGNWSEFGFVPKGGRFNPREQILNTTNVGALKVLWSAQDGSFSLTAPAVVDNVVYSGTNAFDAATGQLLWATNSGGISPAVSKGTVYIDTQNGLCAYVAANGTNLWCTGNNYLPDAPSGAAVVDGIAYFGSALGSVFAIDAATGVQLWSAPISSDNAASSPAVANGVVYINGDSLFAFDAKTGAQLWSSSTTEGTSSPAVVGGVVYCSGRVVAAFNATTGAVLWSVSPGGPLSILGDSPPVAKGLVYIRASV